MEMMKKVYLKTILRYHFLVLNSSSLSDEQRGGDRSFKGNFEALILYVEEVQNCYQYTSYIIMDNCNMLGLPSLI